MRSDPLHSAVNADRMMMNCDPALKARISAHLAAFTLNEGDKGEEKAAAVALAIVDEGFGANLSGLPEHESWQSQAALILTRRSLKLRAHPGQWALPGGRVDEGETPEQTALREMREEVGLELREDAVLGRLDDFITRSGFMITPIVIWAGPEIELVPNEEEVDSIHRIPVAEFLRDDAPMLDHEEGDKAPVLRMPVGDAWIAAPTAAMLYQFAQVCLLGKDVRVAHYDQPRFAWR
ncbi:MAG: CoA pyrophosphatase [Pseudomonadota bacterium]|nr:CoA pyrophosphatase [Pseudomonadota bacterium]